MQWRNVVDDVFQEGGYPCLSLKRDSVSSITRFVLQDVKQYCSTLLSSNLDVRLLAFNAASILFTHS